MKKIILSLLCLLVISTASNPTSARPKIKTGIEVLKSQQFKILQGKRVGLITNPTGVDNDMRSTIDLLYNAPGVKLVALYGPEHGVRGNIYAGASVQDNIDPTTGLPVYSLYGKTRKATAEMLKDIDVLVYDIQDIGSRSFTYISSMGLAMETAAENGKEVVVLVELRARFDEESNIIYSRILEEAGCRVIYGLNGYKVHSKLCLISRKTEDGVSYITQIGTGNYNEKTSALYTDLSLITANQEIGKEAAEVFAALLKGETVEQTNVLLVAPKCLQNKVLDMIDEEIAHVKNGEEGYIGIKINSLTDKVIINKLVEASQAGVKIEMIVRGICCLIPGIKGYTENIQIVSIVGRFLEHSRIYRFGTKEREKVYIASADFMTRNTVRRVEVAAPVLDEKLKARLDWMFETMMNDDEKGKSLTEKGTYVDRSLNDVKMNSQEMFYAMAYSNAEK